MEDDIKYLTDEEFKAEADAKGYMLCPYIIKTTYTIVEEATKNTGVDMSEIDNLDTPTQAPG